MSTKQMDKLLARSKEGAAADIVSFEEGGPGHDTAAPRRASKPKKSKAAPSVPKTKMLLDVPSDLHLRFKMACVANGLIMGKQAEIALEDRTKKLEKLAKNSKGA